jgi:hypothetical protein
VEKPAKGQIMANKKFNFAEHDRKVGDEINRNYDKAVDMIGDGLLRRMGRVGPTKDRATIKKDPLKKPSAEEFAGQVEFVNEALDRARRQRMLDAATNKPPTKPKTQPVEKKKPLMLDRPDIVNYKNGGYVRAADGVAKKGKTKGRMC